MESLPRSCRTSFLLLHKWYKFTLNGTSAPAGNSANIKTVKCWTSLAISMTTLKKMHSQLSHSSTCHKYRMLPISNIHSVMKDHHTAREKCSIRKSNDFTSAFQGNWADGSGNETAYHKSLICVSVIKQRHDRPINLSSHKKFYLYEHLPHYKQPRYLPRLKPKGQQDFRVAIIKYISIINTH